MIGSRITAEDLMDLYERYSQYYKSSNYRLERYKWVAAFERAAALCHKLEANAEMFMRAQFDRKPLPYPNMLSGEVAEEAYTLFTKSYKTPRDQLLQYYASQEGHMTCRLGINSTPEEILSSKVAPLTPLYKLIKRVYYNLPITFGQVDDARRESRLDPEAVSVYSGGDATLIAKVRAILGDEQC